MHAQAHTALTRPLVPPPPVDKDPVTGSDTVGSSEAVLLGGLALKRRWQERRKKAGLDTSKPNIVMGTETHVVGASTSPRREAHY